MSYPPGIREPFQEKWCELTLGMERLTGQEVADMCPTVRLCECSDEISAGCAGKASAQLTPPVQPASIGKQRELRKKDQP